MANLSPEEALKQRVYQGLQKKRRCELCMQSFYVEELPGAITYKSILELRQKWGAGIRSGTRIPSPSQLYKRCELCVFCMQFFDVDGLQDVPSTNTQTIGANSTDKGSSQKSPPQSPGKRKAA